ncbi:uncharacterized protein [Watersipora subatra]|uniref:uncharacterized protein n=1 Tax=Watersipora subatra TaxID=2589382 RepID=UPI00355C9918
MRICLPRKEEGKDHAIMVFNTGLHWLVAAFTPGYILVYDSACTADTMRFPQVKEVPQQTNPNDCGVYALSFLQWLVQKKNILTLQKESVETGFLCGRSYWQQRLCWRIE